ncbi:MAG: hypothetical protein MK141_14250 [Pseudoxanthomonas sp.]|uniref:hypothetical protein n=1 Tax=Pseudoxanthomonas sp. TaxID=1871049 RepID=UPI00258BC2D2|nr:hypothetical protein [Pseudoxanthomonas sp.]MCH2092721.1 hypothetical protein [Pseudoxanthomonas sp.]
MSKEKKATVEVNPADYGIDEETAKRGAAVAKCKPSQVIGYREYGTKATVVVHTDTGVEKVEGDVPATKAQGK